MPGMNLTELNKHIAEITLPILKEAVGPVVAELVKSQVAKSMELVDGMTATQKAQAETIRQLQDATRGKSALSTPKRERQKGEALGAVVKALWRSKNDVTGAAKILKGQGHDDLAEMMVEQAKFVSGDELASKSMLATDPDTGGILIPQPVSAEVIDILRARVTVRKGNPQTITMPAANFRLPKKTQGSTAYYIGEGSAGTTSALKTGSVLLSFKKLVTIVPASNDLMRYSSPGADQMIRDDIADGMAVREDQAFLRGVGTDATPKGLRYWASPDNVFDVTGSTGGTTNIDAVTVSLGRCILKLQNNNVPMIRPVWILAPRTIMSLMTTRVSTTGDYAFRQEMSAGNLWGIPYLSTTQVSIALTEGANSDCSEVYLVDMADVVIGDSERLIIDASSEAAYEEGGSVKAAFSRDETVIRGIAEHDLVVRRDVSIAVGKNVRWGA